MENKNEIKILFATACTSSSIDQQSNTVSLFNILEDIKFDLTLQDKKVPTPQEIGLPFQFDVLAFFARTDSSKTTKEIPIDSKVTLLDPDGKTLQEAPFSGLMEVGKKRFRMTFKFMGIKLTKSGTYNFRTELLKEKGGTEALQTFDVPVDISININQAPEIK